MTEAQSSSTPPRQRGGQPGNNNAYKHGFYARHIPGLKDVALEALDHDFPGLEEEIFTLRLYIRRLLEWSAYVRKYEDGVELIRTLCIAFNTLARLTREHRAFAEAPVDTEAALRQAHANVTAMTPPKAAFDDFIDRMVKANPGSSYEEYYKNMHDPIPPDFFEPDTVPPPPEPPSYTLGPDISSYGQSEDEATPSDGATIPTESTGPQPPDPASPPAAAARPQPRVPAPTPAAAASPQSPVPTSLPDITTGPQPSDPASTPDAAAGPEPAVPDQTPDDADGPESPIPALTPDAAAGPQSSIPALTPDAAAGPESPIPALTPDAAAGPQSIDSDPTSDTPTCPQPPDPASTPDAPACPESPIPIQLPALPAILPSLQPALLTSSYAPPDASAPAALVPGASVLEPSSPAEPFQYTPPTLKRHRQPRDPITETWYPKPTEWDFYRY